MQGKRILLGVTGGIAAYKSPDLVRRLSERGAEVQVVMTAGAREFVTATTFQAVSGRTGAQRSVGCGGGSRHGPHRAGALGGLVLIAPASADFLARLAHGPGRRPAHHAVPCHRGAGRGGAGHESRHVGQRGDAGQRRAAHAARRAACSGPARATRPAAKSARAACWSRSISSTACTRCCRAAAPLSRQARADHRRARRASASIRCASSAIAAPGRWASRSRRRRARPAPRWCSSAAR